MHDLDIILSYIELCLIWQILMVQSMLVWNYKNIECIPDNIIHASHDVFLENKHMQ